MPFLSLGGVSRPPPASLSPIPGSGLATPSAGTGPSGELSSHGGGRTRPRSEVTGGALAPLGKAVMAVVAGASGAGNLSSSSATAGGGGMSGRGGEGSRRRTTALTSTAAAKGRRRAKGGAYETFVFVRPPPSSKTNPMNIQCQLVVATPPAARRISDNSLSTTTSRLSTHSGSTGLSDATGSGTGGGGGSGEGGGSRPSSIAGSTNEAEGLLRPLSRSVSQRSACSIETTASSISPSVFGSTSVLSEGDAGSLRSTASTGATSLSSPASAFGLLSASGGTGGANSSSGGSAQAGMNGGGSSSSATTTKRVVPLYNLQFHTVRQTAVADAGTDAKIGVFQKRALDLQGLGSLECCEMSGPYVPAQASSSTTSAPAAASTALSATGDGSGQTPAPPLRSPAEDRVGVDPSPFPSSAVASPASGRRLAIPLSADGSGPGSPRLSLDTLFTRPSFDDVRFGLGGAPAGGGSKGSNGPRRGLGQIASIGGSLSTDTGRTQSVRSTNGGGGSDRGSPVGGVGKKMVEETAQAGRKLFGRLFGGNASGGVNGVAGGSRQRDEEDESGLPNAPQQQQQRSGPGGFFRSSPAMANLFSSSGGTASPSGGGGRSRTDGSQTSGSVATNLGAIASDARPSSLGAVEPESRRVSISSRRSSTTTTSDSGGGSAPLSDPQRSTKRISVVGAFKGGAGRPKSSAFSTHSAVSATSSSAGTLPAAAGPSATTTAGGAAPQQQATPYLGAPTLGLAPVVRPPVDGGSAASRKTSAYVWVISKWASPSDGWSFAALSESISSSSHALSAALSPANPANQLQQQEQQQKDGQGSSMTTDNEGATSVHFEWIRGRPPARTHTSGTATSAAGASAGRTRASSVPVVDSGDATSSSPVFVSGRKRSGTTATVTSASASADATTAASAAADDPHAGEDGPSDDDSPAAPLTTDAVDEDEDEDPEDSEVPWLCYAVRTSFANPLAKAEVERTLLGKLSPAPHHPKIVAQLRMPFPLAPIDLSPLASSSSDSTTAAGGGGGSPRPALSAEQLKDVVCTTAMFLFIRQEWGGVGRRHKRR